MPLTDRFAEALVFAEKLHRRQTRKGTDIPYIAHLLAVAAMVLEHGGDEDVAIAALLHDAVEDQGGLAARDLIEARFGSRVVRIVMACTDSTSAAADDKAPWEERKRHHVEQLRSADVDVALVTAADKLHNLNALIRDVRRNGPETLERFNAPDRLVWYFASVAEALRRHAPLVPIQEFERRIAELSSLLEPQAGASSASK